MAAPSSALGYLNSITHKAIIPYVVDQVSQTNTTMNLLIKNAQFLDGGDYIDQPIMTGLPTSAVKAYSGTETFDDNFSENVQGAVFNWKFYGMRVCVSGPDMVRNDGFLAALNHVTLRMKEAEIAMRQRLGSDLQGDGTADNGNAFLGWQAAIDDGGSVDSYGGVSRAAFPVWKSFKSSNGTTPRALAIALIDNAVQNTSWDSDTTNLHITSPGLLTKFTQLLQPLQRINSGEVAVAGYKNVFYRGYPVISDMQVPTTPSESWIGLNTRYIQLYFKRGRFFRWIPFQQDTRADLISSMILLAMILVVSRPASQFRIVDLSSAL